MRKIEKGKIHDHLKNISKSNYSILETLFTYHGVKNFARLTASKNTLKAIKFP